MGAEEGAKPVVPRGIGRRLSRCLIIVDQARHDPEVCRLQVNIRRSVVLDKHTMAACKRSQRFFDGSGGHGGPKTNGNFHNQRGSGRTTLQQR